MDCLSNHLQYNGKPKRVPKRVSDKDTKKLVTKVCMYKNIISTCGSHQTSTHQHTIEGWMESEQETVFCWVPVPWVTIVACSVAFFFNHLFTNNPQAGC